MYLFLSLKCVKNNDNSLYKTIRVSVIYVISHLPFNILITRHGIFIRFF